MATPCGGWAAELGSRGPLRRGSGLGRTWNVQADPCNLVLPVELIQEDGMLSLAKETKAENLEAKVLEAWKLPAKKLAKNLLAEKE